MRIEAIDVLNRLDAEASAVSEYMLSRAFLLAAPHFRPPRARYRRRL